MCVCLEVEDEVDKWGPPISEKICGTQLLEGEREAGHGSKDILPTRVDWAPTYDMPRAQK